MPLPPSVMADPAWAHLANHWRPIPKRPGYIVGLCLMGAVIVVVPVLYLGLIAAVLFAAYWPGTQLDIPQNGHGGGSSPPEIFLARVVWVPAIAIVFFLLKPLLASRPRSGRPVELKQYEELKLHSFVENLCTVLGAPVPKRIYVDCDVNASAGFRGGVFGILTRRAELTLGLPLVAMMTKRQLAGVLAHEFGHFAQGTGMLVSYPAERMIGWLARSIYGRDGWDALLEALASLPNPLIVTAAWACKVCIWITRQLLKVPFFAAAVLISFMSRQMEYDSDRHQVQMAGSAAFEPTFRRLSELGWVYGRAVHECMDSFVRKRALPEDFASHVAAMARRLTPEDRDAIRVEREKERFEFLSTHPPTRKRIAHAASLDQPGLYTDDGPAAELFGDFDTAAKRTTRALLRAVLGPYFVHAKFQETESATRASTLDEQRQAILPRYLGYEPPTWRPVFPSIGRIPDIEDVRPLALRLRASRQRLKEVARAARDKAPAYRKASEDVLKWEQARTVLDAGLAFDFKAMHLQPTSRAGVSTAIERCTNDAADAAGVIDEAGEVAMSRLSAALCMLGVDGIERRLPDAATMRARADALLAACTAMREALAPAVAARHATCAAVSAAASIKNQRTLDQAKKAIRPLSDEIRNRLDDVRRTLGGTPDPFAPAGEGHGYGVQTATANLGESVVGASPGWRELDQILDAGRLFVDRYAEYTRRILGELVEIGERVERALAGAGASGSPAPAGE